MEISDEIRERISAEENSTKVSFTKRYPRLLPLILESKRFLNSCIYTLDPRFTLTRSSEGKWTHLVEHSSPLYRKYNKKELDEGKMRNIALAIKNIDGAVIPPGKIFSFWKFVKKPSLKKGFVNGLVISDGHLKEDIGGGLCQLSNLLGYLFAHTECRFIERKHHSRDVFPDSGRSVPFASGATVFFNLIDLKIKNTYPFPIKINVRMTDTQLRGSVSAPVSLQYLVKLEERNHGFVKSSHTGRVYRHNNLYRVFYRKGADKVKIGEKKLWNNVARVMYDEKEITNPITVVDPRI